jgi:hypothetical protein
VARFQLLFQYDDGREVVETGETENEIDPPRDADGTPLWPGQTLDARGATWAVEFDGSENDFIRWVCRPVGEPLRRLDVAAVYLTDRAAAELSGGRRQSHTDRLTLRGER